MSPASGESCLGAQLVADVGHAGVALPYLEGRLVHEGATHDLGREEAAEGIPDEER